VKRKPQAANRRLAKKRVKWLIEHSTSHQLLCWVDSLVLRNPPLLKVPDRLWSFSTDCRDRQKFQNQSQKFELKIYTLTNFW
jgi:hypothetical protein